jgi:hypothetical protein
MAEEEKVTENPVKVAEEPAMPVDGTEDSKAAAAQRALDILSSPNSSWLARNITPIMGLVVLAFAFVFFVFVLRYDFNKTGMQKDIVVYMLGVISTLVTMVVGYYFGSSKGSSDKAKVIANQLNGSES